MARKTKSKARRVAVIDCETDPFAWKRVPEPFLWGFYDGTIYRDFPTAAELVEWIDRTGPYIIYAHNGGKFDYHFMLSYMEPWTEVLIINGRLAKWTRGKTEFRDSWNILPVALATFAKTKIDYSKFTKARRAAHMAEIRNYLKDDCINLFTVVEQFIAEYGRHLTLAGTALAYWKQQSQREVPSSDDYYYKRLVPHYAGGRVECFASGVIRKHFRVYDITSAYPYAMMMPHPFSTDGVATKVRPGEKIIPQSLYTVSGISRGALFVKDSHGGITFPDDDEVRTYQTTGWELQAALDTKTLKLERVIERIDFSEHIHFQEYVNHFFRLKASAPKGSASRQFAKLMLNSLYGKWCACPENYDNYGIVAPEDAELLCHPDPQVWAKVDPDMKSIGRHRGPFRTSGMLGPWQLLSNRLAGPVVYVDDDGIPHNSYPDKRWEESDQRSKISSKWLNVATGASITGFVRAYLWRHICKVKDAGGMMLYCDTDSIACSLPEEKYGKIFRVSERLGDWSLDAVCDKAGIAGKKLYAFHDSRPERKGTDEEWKTAHKGVKLDALAIMDIAAGGSISYANHAPSFGYNREVAWIHRTVTKTAKVVGRKKGA